MFLAKACLTLAVARHLHLLPAGVPATAWLPGLALLGAGLALLLRQDAP